MGGKLNKTIEEMFEKTTVPKSTGRRYYKHVIWARLIWDYHNPESPCKDFDIHHIDGDKLNDNISNLIRLTRSEYVRLHNLNMSDEIRKKMSVNNTGANNPHARAVNINGQIFPTLTESAKYLNVCVATVFNRIKRNFQGYTYA